MRLADFRRMVNRMAGEIPSAYLEGIAGIEVSPRTIPHATRPDVYTMGECVPIGVGGESPPSRVVLYYGSFRALARGQSGFDWRGEAWETLTHELRHHLEWRAHAQELEGYDWAAEQGFARDDEEPFDPLYYLEGERVAPNVYQVDDDVFFDRVVRRLPPDSEIEWRGRRYRVAVPQGTLPLYVVLEGLADPPLGDAILVLRRKPGVWALLRRRTPVVEMSARVEPLA